MKRRSTFLGAALATVLAPFTLSAAVAPGQPAPAFALPVAGAGATISLDRERAAHPATVVMFVSTRCPVSNAYDVRMEELERTYAPRGVRFIGVNSNVNEPASEVAAHAREHGFTFPVVKDDGSRTADAYGAQHTPEIFVVDPSGVVRYHGRIDENRDDPAAVRSPDLRNALDSILAGKSVAVPETKAFGCSIKRG